MTHIFSDLGLHPQLVQTVTKLGYANPTKIQAEIIPLMLSGQDVIGQSQTGTGKTAAFSLPVLQTLTPSVDYVQALILTPTRELAKQVANSVYDYGHVLGVRVLPIYGGQAYSRQIGRLKKGVDIVAGTPGRLLDLIRKGALDLNHITTLILDEADEMLSMGFIEDIETIIKATPATRQTALFSATLPPAIRNLADRYMNHPQSVTIEGKHLTVATIEQRTYLVQQADKLAALTRLLEIEETTNALVFARTRVGTDQLATELSLRGFPAESLHGDMSQEARERVLERFRRGQMSVLVGTDVAARGLDIDDISHVFNYDLPPDPEVYVHRIGRTGRAGRTGVAVSLVTPGERRRVRQIEAYIRQSITQRTLPTAEEIERYRRQQLVQKLEMWLERDRCRQERELVSELMANGHDSADIAAVALKLVKAEEKQRPIETISDVSEQRSRIGKFQRNSKKGRCRGSRSQSGTSQEEGMVRLTLSAGRANGVKVNHVVGSLASHANIPGHTIGKIEIKPQHTLVDVPEQLVGRVLSKANSYRLGSRRVTIKRT